MSDHPGDTEKDRAVTRQKSQKQQQAFQQALDQATEEKKQTKAKEKIEKQKKEEKAKRSSIASQSSEHTVSPEAGGSARPSVSPGGQQPDNIQPETTPTTTIRRKSTGDLELLAQPPGDQDAQSSSQSRPASETTNLPSNPVVNLSTPTPPPAPTSPIVTRATSPPPALTPPPVLTPPIHVAGPHRTMTTSLQILSSGLGMPIDKFTGMDCTIQPKTYLSSIDDYMNFTAGLDPLIIYNQVLDDLTDISAAGDIAWTMPLVSTNAPALNAEQHAAALTYTTRRTGLIGQTTTGEAKQWFDNVHPNTKANWVRFKHVFKKQFDSQHFRYSAQAKARMLKKTNTETVRNFGLRVGQLIDIGWHDQTPEVKKLKKKEIFSQGLTPHRLRETAITKMMKEPTIDYANLVTFCDDKDVATALGSDNYVKNESKNLEAQIEALTEKISQINYIQNSQSNYQNQQYQRYNQQGPSTSYIPEREYQTPRNWRQENDVSHWKPISEQKYDEWKNKKSRQDGTRFCTGCNTSGHTIKFCYKTNAQDKRENDAIPYQNNSQVNYTSQPRGRGSYRGNQEPQQSSRGYVGNYSGYQGYRPRGDRGNDRAGFRGGFRGRGTNFISRGNPPRGNYRGRSSFQNSSRGRGGGENRPVNTVEAQEQEQDEPYEIDHEEEPYDQEYIDEFEEQLLLQQQEMNENYLN